MLVVCFTVLLIVSRGTSASAAIPHAFDEQLSLTGNCSVSSLDNVPDPGPCPIPPGVPGVDHPDIPFKFPTAVATDFYGNIYVASEGTTLGGDAAAAEGRISIFSPSGLFITEIVDELGPASLAVDSDGNLYVANRFASEERVVRYSPTLYKPAEEEIKYSNTTSVVLKSSASIFNGIAIDPSNDHLFVKFESRIQEYKSATEGNGFTGEIAAGELAGDGVGIAVDAGRGRLYASSNSVDGHAIKVFELGFPHALLFTVEESDIPGGKIQSSFLSVAADEGSGHLFVYDGEGAKKVYEFEADGTYSNNTIEHSFQYVRGSQIGVDNGKFSPNGALNPRERYLYVPSLDGKGAGHSYAFGPPTIGEPIVESASAENVGEEEAELEASIEPFGLPTEYTIEYLTTQQYEEQGESFEGAELAGEGTVPATNSPVDVAASAEELEPATRYRFRIFVENSEGTDEAEGEFATYAESEVFELCPNEALRSGYSALLPDCRAYELVGPPDTNARAPRGLVHLGIIFATREASPQGGAVSFQIEGGIIPGSEGTGSLGGDPYLSTRGEEGWETDGAGPSGTEAPTLIPGSPSADQGYSFWSTGG